MGVVRVSGFDSYADGNFSRNADSSFGSNADVGLGCDADGGAARDVGRENRAGDGGQNSATGVEMKDISCNNMEGVKIVLMMLREGKLATIVEEEMDYVQMEDISFDHIQDIEMEDISFDHIQDIDMEDI